MEKIEENEREQGMRKKNDYWLEKANESARHFAKQIDWEQRRWELAHGIFLHYSDLTNKACIEMADEFIKEYKKPLNTEE